MSTIAVVPMKLNNQRLPEKNTKRFTNGEPLCHYILSTLLTVNGVDEVYVYCSNPDMIHLLQQKSCKIFFGKMVFLLTIIWIVFRGHRIFQYYMKKLVVFIFIKEMLLKK